MPLKPIVADKPFAQWGLDFTGIINPVFSAEHKWILTTMDYFTRWMKVVPLKSAIETEIVYFLKELVTRFGPLKTIILDNSRAFLGVKVCHFALNNGIFLKTSSNYYPQGNGLAESTNKSLVQLLKRIGSEHQKEWHKNL